MFSWLQTTPDGCSYFEKSERYVGSIVKNFDRRSKKEHFVNYFLRKFRLL